MGIVEVSDELNLINQPELILSIVIPFHNSALKCKRLLASLTYLAQPSVEIILVDDGSTDNTLDIICEFKKLANSATKIIKQDNKGPGGARNEGFKLSSGKYVWFVDSDDDINLEAVEILKEVITENYDFIDFNILTKEGDSSSINFLKGEYLVDDIARHSLIASFGRICTKVIRRDLIIDNKLYYPEYCIFEDNYLAMVYPFHIKKFYKSDIIGYIHHEDFESVTRCNYISDRYFDRLKISSQSFRDVERYPLSPEIRNTIEEKFITLFLINTLNSIITKAPSSNWLTAARVINYYRRETKFLKIRKNPFELINASKAYCAVVRLLWVFSFMLPNQEKFFQQLHFRTWGKEVDFIY